MKKLLNILLVLLLLAGNTAILHAQEASLSLNASSSQLYPGNTVSVYVYGNDLNDIGALDLGIIYDDKILTLDSVTEGSLLSSFDHFGDINTGVKGQVFTSHAFTSPLSGSGELFVLNFSVDPSAQKGQTRLQVTVGDVTDSSLGPISLSGTELYIDILEYETSFDTMDIYCDSSVSLYYDEETTLSIGTDYSHGMAAADFIITFDSQKLQYKGITLSDTLLNAQGASYSISENKDYIKVSYINLNGIFSYIDPLLSVSFRSISEHNDETIVSFSTESVYDASLKPIYSSQCQTNLTLLEKEETIEKLKITSDSSFDEEGNVLVLISAPGSSNLAAADFIVSFDNTKILGLDVTKKASVGSVTSNIKNNDGQIKFSYINTNGGLRELVLIRFKPLNSDCTDVPIALTVKNPVNDFNQKLDLETPGTSFHMHKFSSGPNYEDDVRCEICGELIYEKLIPYSITFYSNGGSFTDGSLIKQYQARENEELIFPEVFKEDYEFSYWKDEEGNTYEGSSFVFDADKDLYAVYSRNEAIDTDQGEVTVRVIYDESASDTVYENKEEDPLILNTSSSSSYMPAGASLHIPSNENILEAKSDTPLYSVASLDPDTVSVIHLVVEDLEDEQTRQKVEECLSDLDPSYQTDKAFFFDARLEKITYGENISVGYPQPSGNVRISLRIPEEMTGDTEVLNKEYSVLHYVYDEQSGQNELVSLETEVMEDLLSFETSSFSPFILIYKDLDYVPPKDYPLDLEPYYARAYEAGKIPEIPDTLEIEGKQYYFDVLYEGTGSTSYSSSSFPSEPGSYKVTWTIRENADITGSGSKEFNIVSSKGFTLKANTSLTLSDNIAVNMYVYNIDPDAASMYTVYYQKGEDGQYESVNVEDMKLGSDGRYWFVPAQFYSYQMWMPLNIRIEYDDGLGNITSKSFSTSTLKFCTTSINSSSSSEQLIALCKACLDYGANAQLYFNGKRYYDEQGIERYYETRVTLEDGSSGLVNDEFNKNNEIVSEKPSDDYKFSYSGKITGLSKFRSSMVLGSETSLKFTMMGVDETTQVISCTDSKGRTRDFIPLEEESEGVYRFIIPGIKSNELYLNYYFTFRKGEEEMSFTYSPYYYASVNWEGSEISKLVQAMVAYGNIAREYFENQ